MVPFHFEMCKTLTIDTNQGCDDLVGQEVIVDKWTQFGKFYVDLGQIPSTIAKKCSFLTT
jgi:hypothetical protein